MITIERTLKEELIDWLDAQTRFIDEFTYFNDDIYNLSSMCTTVGTRGKTLHVSDARKIAEIIGVEVKKEPWDEKLDEVYFEYNGFRVFHLEGKQDVE